MSNGFDYYKHPLLEYSITLVLWVWIREPSLIMCDQNRSRISSGIEILTTVDNLISTYITINVIVSSNLIGSIRFKLL